MSKDVSDKQSQTVTNQALAERRGLEWRHFHTPFSSFFPPPSLHQETPHTSTSSENSPTWPPTTRRSSSEGAFTSDTPSGSPPSGRPLTSDHILEKWSRFHTCVVMTFCWCFTEIWTTLGKKKQQLYNCHFVFNPLLKWIDAALWRCSLIRTHCLGKLHYTVYYS